MHEEITSTITCGKDCLLSIGIRDMQLIESDRERRVCRELLVSFENSDVTIFVQMHEIHSDVDILVYVIQLVVNRSEINELTRVEGLISKAD